MKEGGTSDNLRADPSVEEIRGKNDVAFYRDKHKNRVETPATTYQAACQGYKGVPNACSTRLPDLAILVIPGYVLGVPLETIHPNPDFEPPAVQPLAVDTSREKKGRRVPSVSKR